MRLTCLSATLPVSNSSRGLESGFDLRLVASESRCACVTIRSMRARTTARGTYDVAPLFTRCRRSGSGFWNRTGNRPQIIAICVPKLHPIGLAGRVRDVERQSIWRFIRSIHHLPIHDKDGMVESGWI